MPDRSQIVVVAPYALWPNHFGTDLEFVQNHLDAGDDVTMLVCNAEMSTCDLNHDHDKLQCMRCMGTQKQGLRALSQPVHVEPLVQLSERFRDEVSQLRTEFESLDDLRSYHLDEFDLGMAALSSLVSAVRDPEPNLVKHRDLLSKFLETAWSVYRSFQTYLDTHATQRVYTFNARFAPLRGVLRACQQRNVDCMVHERGSNFQRYNVFPSMLPHNEVLFQQRAHDAWQEAAGNSRREQIGTQWFQDRAQGKTQAWTSFVKDQQAGQLPSDWDETKENVVIFSSSEDEFVAISDTTSDSIYPTQLKGLQTILQSLAEVPHNLHIYLRIHPNLAKTDNRQTREMHGLRAPFLTVIGANDVASTYDLVRAADRVVTFGSTVGIEAVFWGTPSILVGSSFYNRLGATYNPTTHDEVTDLIQSKLTPKDREAALIYGHYFATFGTQFEHFVPDGLFKGSFRGVRLRPSLWDRVRIWLLKRPRSMRIKLARLVGWSHRLVPRQSEKPPNSHALQTSHTSQTGDTRGGASNTANNDNASDHRAA